MNKQTYKIISNQHRQRCVEHIRELSLDPVQQVVIQDYKKNRSLEQNAAYWAVYLPAIRKKINESFGADNSLDAIHEFMKDRFLDSKTELVMGEVKVLTKTATKLTTKEWSKYIESIEHWCVDNLDGFHLPILKTDEYE